MSDIIANARPEAPELDDNQFKDLRKHFESMDITQLNSALEQTISDAEKDTGLSYVNGGVPASTNRTIAIIQDVIESKQQ